MTTRGDSKTESDLIIGNTNVVSFVLAGTSKQSGCKGTGVVPPAPAQVYHGRGRDSSREFDDEMAAVHNIKICFEKMIKKDTKEIDVSSLFKHMAHHFFWQIQNLQLFLSIPSRRIRE